MSPGIDVEIKPQVLAQRSFLAIEDSKIAAFALKILLSNLGAQVTVAETGQEGLALVASRRFDFIILDFNLPDTIGPEIAKQIRQWEMDNMEKRKPIILVTAAPDSEKEQVCLSAGIDAFFRKPLLEEELLNVCRKLKLIV